MHGHLHIHLNKLLHQARLELQNIVAITVIFKVPIINAQIPNLGSEPVGFQVVENRNSVIGILVKKVMVSKSNVINIPSVVKMEIAEIAAKITGIILSLCFPFLLLFFN